MPAVPRSVHAWIVWEDGVEELVPAQAVALAPELYVAPR